PNSPVFPASSGLCPHISGESSRAARILGSRISGRTDLALVVAIIEVCSGRAGIGVSGAAASGVCVDGAGGAGGEGLAAGAVPGGIFAAAVAARYQVLPGNLLAHRPGEHAALPVRRRDESSAS